MTFSPEQFHAQFVNLRDRTDRREHMERELARVNIPATRFEAFHPAQFPYPKFDKMRNRTPGAIGCFMSQLGVMANAKKTGKSALVMEDDVIFADDIHKRFQYIGKALETIEWDVMYLGATVHLRNEWHKNKLCDIEKTDDPRIFRVYGEWGTYAYVVNHRSIEKVMRLLYEHINQSIGIDYSMIMLSDEIRQYCFIPGSAFQIDSQSSIGNGITYFSHFMKMGRYVFQRGNYNDFDASEVAKAIP